ncbi:hypothetical protein POUND7_004987 [Theobroma cacao]
MISCFPVNICIKCVEHQLEEMYSCLKWCPAVHLGIGLFKSVHSQLQIGFYRDTCSLVEFIVKEEVTKAFIKENGVVAGLMRMHFHDCFVRGCDGSVLLDSTPSSTAEKDSFANNPSLRGYEVIDNAKARLEAVCKGVVSCADIVAFAARDSIEIDPSLDPRYAAMLKQQCPQGNKDTNLVVPMNPSSPSITDAGYYVDILANRGLFTSDHTLLTNPATANQVTQNARNPMQWRAKFGAAMVKMGQLEVLTGTAGEIRAN